MHSVQQQDPWLGRSVGERQRYRLDRRLGAGGMAEVFLATDTLLGQPVALKLLNETLAAGEMRGRFDREAALCAALRSDHIVRVSDYGITPAGNPFFVMEYLPGQTLKQLLNCKTLPVERIVKIVSQICAGLDLAHQGITLCYPGAVSQHVKIVHRDLKPDNIFLVPTGLGELVKILDFGIAKIRSQTEACQNADATRMFLGTYRYAAPEQFEIGKDLDGRADLYSLGVMLYEMLSGTDPFGFGFPVAQVSGGTWAVAHLNRPVRPLREQPGCEQLSPELESLVMRCLEKDPAQRFTSVRELSKALCVAVGIPEIDCCVATVPPTPAIDPAPTAAATTLSIGLGRVLKLAETLDFLGASPPQNQVLKQTLDRSTEDTESHALATTENYRQRLLNRSLLRHPALLWTGAGLLTVFLVLIAGLELRNLPRFNSSRQPEPIQTPVLTNQTTQNKTAQSKTTQSKTLLGHTDTVWAVAAAPDRKTLVSGSFDKTVRLWNLQTGAATRTLTGHTDAVRAVAVSANGQIVASGSSDQTIKIWQLASGKLLHTLTGHKGPVWSIAISPDSQTLASGSYDGTIKLWNLQTGKLLHTLPDHYDSVWAVAISPDGQTLASGSYDGTIKLWDLQTGKLQRTLSSQTSSGHTEAVRSVAISPNGQTLVSASWDKTLKVWDLPTGKLLHRLTGHTDRVVATAISPSGQTIVSASLDHSLKVWQLSTGQLLQTLTGHQDWAVAVGFAPNGQVISGSRDRTIKIWPAYP
jgi:eukaryotic-like serine/threonine-protein kinase